ncbi:MAG: hypothetical protein MAG795_00679 [Candidatus Woesearchaeota archaeon]|nr:hypothetical protein [Candidatus Woesearchaeota archaeon]
MAKNKKYELSKYGPWAFYVALIVAVVLVFLPNMPWAIWLLAALGLVVGLLNVSEKESTPFLLSTLAWMVASTSLYNVLGVLPGQDVVGLLVSFLENVVTFVGPAAAVVAMTTLYYVTKD